jgi:hypothetical protein
MPQVAPIDAHVIGVHEPVPQTYGPAPPQKFGMGQLPQSIRPPHPSPLGPHWRPSDAHVCGVHGDVHLLALHKPVGQKSPHPPQLFGSFDVFTHAPPHFEKPASHPVSAPVSTPESGIVIVNPHGDEHGPVRHIKSCCVAAHPAPKVGFELHVDWHEGVAPHPR